MKIYGNKTLGNPIRVAYFLAEKGVDMEFVPVDLMSGEHRGAAHTARNPFHQVPVMELDDGSCISESIAICRYLEHLHPEPNLMGSDPLDEAIIEMWQRRVELHLYAAARAVFRHTSPMVKLLEPVQIADWAELNRPKVREALEIINHQLGANEFLAGDHYSVADITLLFTTDMLKRIEISPAEGGKNFLRWYDQVRARPSVQKVRA